MVLDARIRDKLLSAHDRRRSQGELLSPIELEAAYRMFKDRFGPAVLSSLEGEDLLAAMYDARVRTSLVRWLNHGDPDDPRLHRAQFGLIGGGGQPGRFGLYRAAETGEWVQGKSPQSIVPVTTADAIQTVTRFRDQLLAGAHVLNSVMSGASDARYEALQKELEFVAPDLVHRAWVHKYYHMLRPDLLDDFHVRPLQDHHLAWLGQMPPSAKGRYVCAGRFVRITHELGVPMNDFAKVMAYLNPYSKAKGPLHTKKQGPSS